MRMRMMKRRKRRKRKRLHIDIKREEPVRGRKIHRFIGNARTRKKKLFAILHICGHIHYPLRSIVKDTCNYIYVVSKFNASLH